MKTKRYNVLQRPPRAFKERVLLKERIFLLFLLWRQVHYYACTIFNSDVVVINIETWFLDPLSLSDLFLRGVWLPGFSLNYTLVSVLSSCVVGMSCVGVQPNVQLTLSHLIWASISLDSVCCLEYLDTGCLWLKHHNTLGINSIDPNIHS